eukprot:COSAG02_NODE_10102_length_2023_cov_1.260395_3_plen_53_part_01
MFCPHVHGRACHSTWHLLDTLPNRGRSAGRVDCIDPHESVMVLADDQYTRSEQ